MSVAGVVGVMHDLVRSAGASIVGLIGGVLLVPTVGRLLAVADLALAGLGAVVSLVLLGAGYLLHRAAFAPAHTLRVAAWAVLGTGVLGLVVGLIALAGVVLPGHAIGTLLAVSALAHVLIGVRDIQRIRAEDLARQREKVAVLNRIVRHNLRHEAQILLGLADGLPEGGKSTWGAGEGATAAEDLTGAADRLTQMHETLSRSQKLVGTDRRTETVALSTAVEAAVADRRGTEPDATVEVDVDDGLEVRAGPNLETAIGELVENALVHGGDRPQVGIETDASATRVELLVSDDGPGIEERYRSVITRETDITQLDHSQGLGLWFVRWAMDAYDGAFDIETGESGTTVSLSLPRA